MSVSSRKNKSLKKSSRSLKRSKNLRSSKKTRKCIKKLRGGGGLDYLPIPFRNVENFVRGLKIGNKIYSKNNDDSFKLEWTITQIIPYDERRNDERDNNGKEKGKKFIISINNPDGNNGIGELNEIETGKGDSIQTAIEMMHKNNIPLFYN